MNELQINTPQASILVVDDAEINLALLVAVLSENGYEVEAATSGQKALSIARQEFPDLILLDVMMPEMNGFEVCEQLKDDPRTQEIPIIFISALNQVTEIVKGFAAGGVDFVTKPFQVEEILARVETHLALRRTRAVLQQKNAQLEQEIAERKQAEQQLQLTQYSIDKAVDAIFWVGIDGNIHYANDQACRLLGYAPETLLNKTLFDIDHNYSSEVWPAHWQSTQQRPITIESTYTKKDGEIFPVEVTFNYLEFGEQAYNFVFVRDLTQRRWAAEALRQVHNQLKQRINQLETLNHIAQTVAKGTDLRSVLKIVAETMTQLFEAARTDIALLDEKRTTLTVVAEKARDEEAASALGQIISVNDTYAFAQVVNSGQIKVVTDPQNNLLTKPIHTLLRLRKTQCLMLAPLLARGEVIGTIAVDTTDSDREFSEAEISLLETVASQIAGAIENARLFDQEQRQRQIVESRNDELDAFARTVAHDIKGPLGVVYSQADLLAEFLNRLDPDQVRAAIDTIKEYSLKGANIVDELLLLAGVRKRVVPLGPLDTAELLERVQQRLSFMLAEYQGEIKLPTSWPAAKGYGPWVEEVWVNYISNGLKYGGKPPYLELGAASQPDQMIRFWVRDNGDGIPAEKQSHLFNEFTQLDGVQVKGYGLGLSIVRRIVSKLGGTVGVNSQVGQGSEFYFTLPAADE